MKRSLLIVAGIAALVLPAAAGAQSSSYNDWNRGGYSGYGGSRGDYLRPRERTTGIYPEFRGIEQHICNEIREGLQEGDIDREDASDLMRRLHQIQGREYREFQVHGWNLPQEVRESIMSDLDDLDSMVDDMRDDD